MNLILGSGSARRREMLRALGLSFEVSVPEIEESIRPGELAERFVSRLAREKAEAVSRRAADAADWAVLAADTIVVHRGRIYGKPADSRDALAMLQSLSGKWHEVWTGFCWLGQIKRRKIRHVERVCTRVRFAKMTKSYWIKYIESGEPMDKAGAYAAQGMGMSFIREVAGSYSNVIGLPLPQVLAAFKKKFQYDLVDNCR